MIQVTIINAEDVRILFNEDRGCYQYEVDELENVCTYPVHPLWLVGDLVNEIFPTFFEFPFVHHKSELLVFDENKKRIVLSHYLTWFDQNINEDVTVIRFRAALFKPAKAA